MLKKSLLMSELGFRMGAQGERSQHTRLPRRKATARRNWQQQGQQQPNDNTASMDSGLNSFGAAVDQMRNQQTPAMNLGAPQVHPTQTPVNTEAFKERLQQRRARRQSALNQGSQQNVQPQVAPVQVQRQAVQVQPPTADTQQQQSAFWDMSAVAGSAPVIATNQEPHEMKTSSHQQQKTATPSVAPDPALAIKMDELEKRQQEILVAIQREEVQRRKLEVSIRALHQELTDIRRAGEDPVGQQDDVRREMRELQHSLNSAMTDTSNRMQEQIRVIIEQSENSKSAITNAVDEMLHHHHDLLYWMYATVVSDLNVYEHCDTNSNVIAFAPAGSKVLMHHPMIELENSIWMQCRTVDKMGNSRMGHVCILEKPDKYWVTDFGLYE
jgi:hypothetical protein